MDWLEEEENRANKLNESGETSNPKAPQLVRIKKEPARKVKGLYMQEKYIEYFDELVFKQKKMKGKTSPELAEEAIILLLKKYKLDISSL